MNRTFRFVVLLVLVTAMWAGTALALQVYKGPTEMTGTVVQVFSGNSFAIFDGESTSVVVLEGIKTPKRDEESFLESAEFLYKMIYQKMVRVQITRKARFITYGVVSELEERINVNAQVLAQPFAEEEMEVAGGAIASMTLRGNDFYSPTVGFSITKPGDWVFLSAEDVQAGREAVRLDDRELERAVRSRQNVPLVAIAKYPEPYENLNPSVSVLAKSVGGVLGKDPVDLLQSTVPNLEKAFGDFTIIEGPDASIVSGRPAAYMKATYTIMDMGGKTYKTVSRIYLVPRGTVMFMMSLSCLETEEAQVGPAFDQIVASIRIEL